MSICELLFGEDVPPRVAIDEAIELAKKYSTEKSGAFVNGILDTILKRTKPHYDQKKKERSADNRVN